MLDTNDIRMRRDLGYGIWNPTHLYINDDGVCYCGRHMGVESTYMPHAWSDLGATSAYACDGVTLRCEDPACTPVLTNRSQTKNATPDTLRMVLGVAAEPEQTEPTNMPSKKKSKTTEQTVSDATELKTDAAAPAKKAKPPKPEKPKREPRPKEEGLVVFAFRLTPEERDAIHAAAGPARASRYVRTILVAAAKGDEAAIRTTIKEAREAR